MKKIDDYLQRKIRIGVLLLTVLFAAARAMADTGPVTSSLDGEGWFFATDADNVGISQNWWMQAVSEATAVKVPHEDRYLGVAWYWRDFTPSLNPHNGGRYLLKFWGVQFRAQVWLNNTELGSHDGGEEAFVFDVSDAILPGQINRLAVRVILPGETRIESLVFSEIPARQASGGIWDSVDLMEVPALYLDDPDKVSSVRIRPPA